MLLMRTLSSGVRVGAEEEEGGVVVVVVVGGGAVMGAGSEMEQGGMVALGGSVGCVCGACMWVGVGVGWFHLVAIISPADRGPGEPAEVSGGQGSGQGRGQGEGTLPGTQGKPLGRVEGPGEVTTWRLPHPSQLLRHNAKT